MTNIVAILLGHRWICIAFGMLYFPFLEVTGLAFGQKIAIIVYFLLRLCGFRLKWTEALKGIVYCFNIFILSLAIYGMTKRVPIKGTEQCFDL